MSTVLPEELSAIVRENIRRRRKDLGLTQQQLADRMSSATGERVHVPYISDLENGIKMPGLATIARIAEALETVPQDLLAESEKISTEV
jgi:transcriptional regulator with XRE-family HTH domain